MKWIAFLNCVVEFPFQIIIVTIGRIYKLIFWRAIPLIIGMCPEVVGVQHWLGAEVQSSSGVWCNCGIAWLTEWDGRWSGLDREVVSELEWWRSIRCPQELHMDVSPILSPRINFWHPHCLKLHLLICWIKMIKDCKLSYDETFAAINALWATQLTWLLNAFEQVRILTLY